MSWSSEWTDVPDDGNCMIHGFYLALKKILEIDPELAAVKDVPELGGDPAACRGFLTEAIYKDEAPTSSWTLLLNPSRRLTILDSDPDWRPTSLI